MAVNVIHLYSKNQSDVPICSITALGFCLAHGAVFWSYCVICGVDFKGRMHFLALNAQQQHSREGSHQSNEAQYNKYRQRLLKLMRWLLLNLYHLINPINERV